MTKETSMTGASLLLKQLQQHQVKHIFGYPGGAIMPIYDALYDSTIKHFLCRHEQGAAFSAVGYARASKSVGVCFATSGPGATNLITGLADAMADSIPVIAITGQVATQAMGSDAFQEVDIIGLSLACTKHCFQIKDVNELEDVIQQAFTIATSGRQGPVLIDIPKDIQLAQVKKPLTQTYTNTAAELAKSSNVEQAKSLLQQAQKPILYVGGGVGMANAVDELRDFIATSQIPSVSTLKGLGAVLADQDYHLGMLGMHGTKAANLAVQESDLLIAVGARFDDRVTGKLAEFAPHAKIIQLDIDQAEINKRRQVDVALMGSLAKNLAALSTPLTIQSWQQHCQSMKHDFAWQYPENETTIYPPKVLNQLSRAIPVNSVVTTDVGQHQMWAAQHMAFNLPNNFLTSGGLGTMGFGLPAAIGAQISRPQDTVIAISGDGSFMMNVQELSTIKRFQLPIKIVLIDNSKLGMVRQWQELFFEQRYSETDLSDNPDFVALAKAFDITATTVSSPDETSQAIEKMLAHEGAYLLHVKAPENENVWPLVPPNTANQHMLENN